MARIEQVVDERLHGIRPPELARVINTGSGSIGQSGGILKKSFNRATEGRGIERIAIAGDITADMGQTAGGGGDHRTATGHGLQHGKTESLSKGRKQKRHGVAIKGSYGGAIEATQSQDAVA